MSESGNKLVIQINNSGKSKKLLLEPEFLKNFLGKSIKDNLELDIEGEKKKYIITGASTNSGTPLYMSCNSSGYTYIVSLNSKSKGKKRIHGNKISNFVKTISLKLVSETNS
jgi:ribosomal protein S6E (S10)